MKYAIGTSSPGEQRARARLLLLTVLALTGLLCVLAGSASALTQRGYVFSKALGSEGTGSGQMRSPSGVATNQSTGEVYVVDSGNNRVDRFNANGEFVSAWGWGVQTGAKVLETCTTACKAGIAARGKGALFGAREIAIDNDPGSPSFGDVYVEAVLPFEKHETEFEGLIINKYSATGSFISAIKGWKEKGESTELFEGEEAHGLTVNALGELLVYYEEGVVEFDNAVKNNFLRLFESEAARESGPREGIAEDAAGDLYFGVSALESDPGSPTVVAKDAFLEGEEETTTLIGALNPENTTGFAVDPKTQNLFLDNVASVAMVSPDGELLDRFGNEEGEGKVAILGRGAGVATRTDAEEPKLSDVLVADAEKGVVDLFVPEPAGPPRIDELGAANTTATSTELGGAIDPHGEATSYFFRYSPEAVPAAGSPCTAPCVEVPVPAGSVGAAGHFGDITLAAQKVEGLSPFTVYHYKLFAANAAGAAESPEQKVRTLPSVPSEQPDHRGLSVLSPADKNGGFIEGITRNGGTIQAAKDGTAATYVSSTALPGAKGNNAPELTQVLSTRDSNTAGQQEWSTEDLSTPADKATGALPSYVQYKIFSADLSRAIVKPIGTSQVEEPQLSSEASERTVYVRNNSTCAASEATCFTPLVSEKNVSSEEGGKPTKYGGPNVGYLGSNPSLAQSVISSAKPLNNEGFVAPLGIYETSGGTLKLVNILPDGTVASNPHLGGPAGADHLVRNAISADGSRVIWNDNKHLYVRDMALGKTVQVDAPQGVAEEPGLEPSFQSASSDGGTIFFSDGAKLLPGARATAQKPDLYVCEPVELDATPKCKLTVLTAGAPGTEAGWLQGAVPGSAEDGSDVFFVADGVLAAGAKPGNCIPNLLGNNHGSEQTFGNTCSLYVDRRNAETGVWEAPEFIAELSLEDEPDWSNFGGSFDLSRTTSRVSPDGRWMTFMSDRSLTGYNNRDVASGKADEEVFLYDVATKKLVCASCDPSGGRPHGVHDVENSGEGIGLLVDRRLTWVNRWLAANIPGWSPIDISHALYQSRYLQDGGRLFFNSAQQLSPRDHNHTQDVYEFEPAGFKGADGSEVCTTGSDTYSESAGGCIALISGGTPEEKESSLLDASENGNDVFFNTAAPLVTQDGDTSYDVYDAGVCGIAGAPECVPQPAPPPPPCEALESCRGGASGPTLGLTGGGSLAPSGSGNTAKSEVLGSTETKKPVTKPKPLTRAQKYAKAVKACKKLKNKHKRATCLKAAKKKYGPVSKKAKRAVHHTAGARGR